MKTIKGILLPGAVLGVFVCAAAAQNTPYKPSNTSPKTTPAPTMPTSAPDPAMPSPEHALAHDGPCRASKLLGKDIVNTSNEKVGSLKDLIVDESGKLVAIVKRSDGQLAGVPMESLTPKVDIGEKKAYAKDGKPESPAKPDEKARIKEFMLASGVEKLNDAPLTNDVANIDHAWLTRVREHYNGSSPSTQPDRTDPAAPAMGATASAGARICSLDKLIGTDVKSTTGEDIGKIEDVAVNVPDARLAYALISTGGVLGMGSTAHGVSWKSLTLETSGKACIVSLDKAAIEKSPGIDLDHLPVRPDLMLSAASPMGPGPVAQEPRR